MYSINYFVFRLLYHVIMISQTKACLDIGQSYISLCNTGLEFSPANEQALLLSETNISSIVTCADTCYTTNYCRTFNYDDQTKHCRFYEGDIDTTGSIISSLSTQSLCGSLQLVANEFVDYGRPCSYCENSRYLTCRNDSCQCQSHTYYDGSLCRSQKLNGSTCTNNIECRNDLNLICLSNMQCGYNSTTSITTSSISVTTSTTSSTIITTTSTTTTSSTTSTTAKVCCSSSCLNQTWTSSLNRLATWSFDGSYRDQMNNYNIVISNPMSFSQYGYVKDTLFFAPNTKPMAVAPYIPLSSSSFTVDMWLYITGLQNVYDHGLFGLCPQLVPYRCLHLTIRLNKGNYHLYLGFYGYDGEGVTSLPLKTWIHAAFVWDLSTMTQKIYLNGILENTCTQSSALNLTTKLGFTIGFIPIMSLVVGSMTYFQGYMDEMTVASRAKSSCEILEVASLVSYFTFDNGSFTTDSGPNSLVATTQSTSITLSGRYSQAITFNGTNSSYFQVYGFKALATTDKPFSISLWIQPTSLSGVIAHVSSLSTGTGWCLPFLGFTSTGSLVAQIYNSNGPVSVISPVAVSTSVWSHIVQTWSSTNGLRLYINNSLVASNLALATSYLGSWAINYITLGNSLNSDGCGMGAVNRDIYKGDMDDFRVYSRELSAGDICTLYTN